MQKELQELINISRHNGIDKRYVIAGGGNTSINTGDKLWVKASGFALSDITDDVLRAVLYIMEQEYETGQAVPVTGGQNMLR